MALEQKNAEHQQVVDKFHDPTASYSMTTRDYLLAPDAVTNTASIIITLPPVMESIGRFYSIVAADASNAYTITITSKGDSMKWPGDIILNEAGRGNIFYSDGSTWKIGTTEDPHFTSSLISGAVNLREVHLTMDTDGAATADALIVRLQSTAVLGNSAGAIFAQVNYSDADARVQGLSYAIGAEMILPNKAGIASGHYACIDYELSAGALTAWGGGTKVSYMRFAAWGTQTEVDDTAFWFTLAGNEELGHLVSLNAHTIRCQIEALGAGTNKERHVVLSTVENSLTMVVNHILVTERALNITTTQSATTGTHIANRFQLTPSSASGDCNSYTMNVRNTVDTGVTIQNQRCMYLESEVGGTGVITGVTVPLHIETWTSGTATIAEAYGIWIQHYIDVNPAGSYDGIRIDHNGSGTLDGFLNFRGASTSVIRGNANSTNLVLAEASGDLGCTIGADGMTANPENDQEAGYITINVASTSYQVPFYAA